MPAISRIFIARASRLFLILFLLVGVVAASVRFAPAAPVERTTLPVISASGISATDVKATTHSARASSGPAAVEGWVRAKDTLAPVALATAHLGDATTQSNEQGYFSFGTEAAAAVRSAEASHSWNLAVRIEADGYAPWVIDNATYYEGDALRLYASLEAAGSPQVEISAAKPRFSQQQQDTGDAFGQIDNAPAPAAPASGQDGNVQTNEVQANGQLLGPNAPTAPPGTIRVYRTAQNTVEVVPFRDYVKHVLPNEWIPTWAPESLKAGAMAVKSYAWYWVSRGGKQVALGADVKDNVEDQVYDPNVSYASTDAAVDATFDYVMTINGALFAAQYCAGSYSGEATGACPWNSLYMTQWGSAYHADRGKKWGWILGYYYYGSRISPNPPGGGYDGSPPATPAAQPTTAPPPPPPSGGDYSVGQGADQPEVFRRAYERNGGQTALGRTTGPVRWWLPYVTEFNLQAQRFAGADGRGDVWIVFDVLKTSPDGVQRAFLLTGDIAREYTTHTPSGPEWVGAPTSDPYTSGPEMGGLASQGFSNGTLEDLGDTVRFNVWPQRFTGWKAEYFPGHTAASSPNGVLFSLPGKPALVRDLPAPDFDWSGTPNSPQGLGAGSSDWSAQFTKDVTLDAGSYDITIRTDGGVRLWLDGALVVNSWQDRATTDALPYGADLAAGTHTVRIQYYHPTPGGKMQFTLAPRGGQPPPAPQPQPTATPAPPVQQVAPPPVQKAGTAQLRVRVQWLGRGASPSDSWVQPLTLLLSAPGNPAILGKYQATTDRNGVAFYGNLPQGTYDVHVKGAHSIQSARAGVALTTTAVADVDMKTQIEGDVDGDNCVTIDDFSAVQGMLGANKTMPGFDSRADLNNDGLVTMSDISLLRAGFERCGDISADNEFRALSTSQGPTLAQQLGPWTNPDTLQHNLSYELAPSARVAKAGDIVQIDVVAQAGTQGVDGASFVLRFDPQRFAVVDQKGNTASAAEPGYALPSVMGNWVDPKGGQVGYSAGIMQGSPLAGRMVLATLRFRVLPGAPVGPASFDFAPLPSEHMQITMGGANLLSTAQGTTVTVNR